MWIWTFRSHCNAQQSLWNISRCERFSQITVQLSKVLIRLTGKAEQASRPPSAETEILFWSLPEAQALCLLNIMHHLLDYVLHVVYDDTETEPCTICPFSAQVADEWNQSLGWAWAHGEMALIAAWQSLFMTGVCCAPALTEDKHIDQQSCDLHRLCKSQLRWQ